MIIFTLSMLRSNGILTDLLFFVFIAAIGILCGFAVDAIAGDQ